MEPKYNLSETTQEERNTFMQELNNLLDKNSFYFEPIPQYERKDLFSPWELKVSFLLNKKTPSIDTADKIPSDNLEVLPDTVSPDESDQTA